MDKIIRTFRIHNDDSILRSTSVRYDTGGRPHRIVLRDISGKEFVTHREYMDLKVTEELVTRSTPGGVFSVQNQRTVGVWVHDSYDDGVYFGYGEHRQTRADALEDAHEDFEKRASRL